MGEIPFMEEEKRKALAFMKAYPRVEVRLIADRFVAFWTGLVDPWQRFLSADTLVRVLLLCSTASALGGLLGIAALLGKRSPYAFPLVAYPFVFPWLYYVTHSNLRYRHPIDPAVLLLVAIAAGSLAKKATAPSGSVMEAGTGNGQALDDGFTGTAREGTFPGHVRVRERLRAIRPGFRVDAIHRAGRRLRRDPSPLAGGAWQQGRCQWH